jgi:hypothetical protein
MNLYGQRDPRWANHPLGWGPALGTLGQYGCFDTVLAMIANDSGHQVDPASLDDLFTAAHIFVREPTGTYDLLPDDALPKVYPGDYTESSYWGWRGDLVGTAVPSPNTYAILWISTASVPTHFVLAYSADGKSIADPWTGRVGTLAGYGGSAAVHKTILVTHVPGGAPPATPAQPATSTAPATIPAEPANTTPPAADSIPLPTPPPMAFYAFVTDPPDDTHPADEVTTLADAMQLANDYVADKAPGTVIAVCDSDGNRVYLAAATPADV